MNTISFTTDPQLAVQASMDPSMRVVLVTEHAPQFLIQNPNVVKLPILLPPFHIVSNYIDYGEDAFRDSYYNYLISLDTLMNVYLIGVALFNKNIIIYTTEEEWSRDSIPFMEVLIRVFSEALTLIQGYPIHPNALTLNTTDVSISDAVSHLFMNGYINEQSFVRYIKSIPSFRSEVINNYLISKGIDLDSIPEEIRSSAVYNIINTKADDINLTPALVGD